MSSGLMGHLACMQTIPFAFLRTQIAKLCTNHGRTSFGGLFCLENPLKYFNLISSYFNFQSTSQWSGEHPSLYDCHLVVHVFWRACYLGCLVPSYLHSCQDHTHHRLPECNLPVTSLGVRDWCILHRRSSLQCALYINIVKAGVF